MHNPKSVQDNETHKLPLDFVIQTYLIINKKKRTCGIVDFSVPADHRVKLWESEKKDKYLDIARELKKLCTMKVTIVTGVHQMIDTRKIGIVNNRTSGDHLHHWDLPEYWEESWWLEEICSHSNSRKRPSAKADVTNSRGVTLKVISERLIYKHSRIFEMVTIKLKWK